MNDNPRARQAGASTSARCSARPSTDKAQLSFTANNVSRRFTCTSFTQGRKQRYMIFASGPALAYRTGLRSFTSGLMRYGMFRSSQVPTTKGQEKYFPPSLSIVVHCLGTGSTPVCLVLLGVVVRDSRCADAGCDRMTLQDVAMASGRHARLASGALGRPVSCVAARPRPSQWGDDGKCCDGVVCAPAASGRTPPIANAAPTNIATFPGTVYCVYHLLILCLS